MIETNLTQELATTMEWLRESAQSGADMAAPFIAEQTPLYIQELITFTIIWSSIKLLAWLILFAAWVILLLKIKKSYTNDLIDSVDKEFCLLFTFIIGAFVLAFLLTETGITDGIKASIAPRVFIVDKLVEVLP